MAWFGIERQNLGAYLESKVHWKSNLSKYGINKSLSPIFVFFNEKKNCKDSADFWLYKSELCYIWPSIPNQTKYLTPFYGSFHRPLALLTHH